MKSIVVGYPDKDGRSKPKVICGPEISDADQARVFFAAKRNGQFPKGIARMEYAFVDELRTVIAIRSQASASADSQTA